MCAHVCTGMHPVYRGQRKMLGVLLYQSLPSPLRQDLSLNLRLSFS